MGSFSCALSNFNGTHDDFLLSLFSSTLFTTSLSSQISQSEANNSIFIHLIILISCKWALFFFIFLTFFLCGTVLLWHLIVQNYKTQLSHNGWIVIYIISLTLWHHCDLFDFLRVLEGNEFLDFTRFVDFKNDQACVINSDKYFWWYFLNQWSQKNIQGTDDGERLRCEHFCEALIII
jgi:hypothetical protein